MHTTLQVGKKHPSTITIVVRLGIDLPNTSSTTLPQRISVPVHAGQALCSSSHVSDPRPLDPLVVPKRDFPPTWTD